MCLYLREKASNEGFGDLFTYFAQSVKRNLHVILIMDVKSETFQHHCNSNPALYKQCRIFWLEDWSPKSMMILPNMLLSKPDDQIGKEGTRSKQPERTGKLPPEEKREE